MPMFRPQPSVASCHLAALLAIAAVAHAQAPAETALPADRRDGAAAVTEAMCREWLGTLASPEFEGRGTGQPGFQKAADFVAAHFRALGLEARGEKDTYFQHVPWASTKVAMDKTFVTFLRGGAEVLRIPATRLAGTATAALSAEGEVVLLCIQAPEPKGEPGRRPMEVPAIPGLDAVDVKDKVVVAFVRAPEGQRAGLVATRFAVQQALQGKSPAAVVFAQDAAVADGLRGRTGMSRRGGGNPAAAAARRSPLDVTFGGADLEAMMIEAGMAKKDLETAPLATALPALRGRIEVAIHEEQAPAMNVWAVLPGSDPKLRDEYVVIGSHLDHLGKRGDTIWPGADDDASGTTGVLAVAQMFAQNRVKPARSILFVCFCGEETGLVGSRFFAENPPVPLASIVSELQMDMIGRDEEENAEGGKGEKAEDNRNSLHLVGTEKLAPALHDLCLAKNTTAGFDIEYDQESMFGRSDHANFAKMGVPIAFFFTGLHRDYHQPTDTPEKIHFSKLLRIARYVYDIAFELATQESRPMVDPDLWGKYRGKGAEKPAAPMLDKAATKKGD